MNKHFDTLLKLGIIVILIVAATTKQHYNYYTFVHWSVFISSIYFAYKSKQQIGIYGIRFFLIFFFAFAILFNPFIAFDFRVTTWRIIDIIVCLLIAITLDWKEYIASLSARHKLRYLLVKGCIWGVVAVVAAVWFVIGLIKVNPFDEYLLITKGLITNGFITNAEEYEDEVYIPDSQGGGSETVTNVYYKYQFTTQDGRTITDVSSELGGIEDFKGKQIPIQVEYLRNDPKVNRVKDATNQCITLGEFIWRRILLCGGILIWACSIGFFLIKNAIQKYLTASKELTGNIEQHGYQ